MMHPYYLIREKWRNKWQMDRVEGLVLVGQYFRLMRREIPENNAFIMRHEDFPPKELYATNRMVYIT